MKALLSPALLLFLSGTYFSACFAQPVTDPNNDTLIGDYKPNYNVTEREFLDTLNAIKLSLNNSSRLSSSKAFSESKNIDHQSMISLLKEALQSDFLALRIQAALILNSVGDKSGVAVMIKDISAEDPNDRASVVSALRTIKDKRATPVLIKAADDSCPYIRCIAISTLGEMQAMEAFDVIALHLHDKAIPTKTDIAMSPAQSVCYAFGLLGNKKAIPLLIKALGDKDLTDTACEALTRLRRGNSPFRSGFRVHQEELGCDVEKWTQWWEWENLNGKAVQVRVYRDWKDDPAAFEIIPITLKKHSLGLNSVNADSSAALAILAEDQNNEMIRTILRNRVYAWPYKQGLSFRLPHYSDLQDSRYWFINDALGNIIKGATVEIFLYEYKGAKIKIGEIVSDGSIRRTIPQKSLRQFEFIVSHPNYGIAKVTEPFNNKNHMYSPLLSEDSDASDRAIWGFVLDAKNTPVARAEISCTEVRTLGEGLINAKPSSGRNVAMTDENGFFSLYLPTSDQFQDQRGQLIPPKSKYHLRITAPHVLGLRPVNTAIENGRESIIVMENLDITETFENLANVTNRSFRALVFNGEDGTITEPDKLKLIEVTIHRLEKPMILVKYDDFKNRAMFPNGTYRATMWNVSSSSSLNFEVLEVTEESPEELVFEFPYVTYYGRIVNGVTKEPMEGAFVMAMRGSGEGNLSMITPEQWDQLHALETFPRDNDPALNPLRRIYGFSKIVRTNEDGQYSIEHPVGDNPYGFLAFEENYTGVLHRKYNLKTDEEGYCLVPVKKLFPAAKVYVEPRVEHGGGSVMPVWLVESDNNSSWVTDLLAQDDQRESSLTYNKWLKRNKLQSFYVPANVNLRVQLSMPYESQWCPFTYSETINLAHGETLDLGKCTFEPALKIYVKVTDQNSKPIEGVPVRKPGSVAHNTDENGIVEFNIPPYSKGDFVVTYWSNDDEHSNLKESIPYEISGMEDDGSQYLFQISSNMVYHLFK